MEGRGWALITVDAHLKDAAFRAVVDLAREWQWRHSYQIKRVDVVERLTGKGPAYSLFVAVKTQSEDQLPDAFNAILKQLPTNHPPDVDGYRARNSLEIDW